MFHADEQVNKEVLTHVSETKLIIHSIPLFLLALWGNECKRQP